MTVASRTGRLLRRLVRVASRRPVLTIAAAVVAAAACVVYALTTLTFATSTRALLPPHSPFVDRYAEYDQEFGELDELVIAVEAPSLPEASVYANRLVREIRAAKVPVTDLAYRIDPKQFEGRALLYLSNQRLLEIRDRIFDYQDFMQAFAGRPTLDQLIEGIATQIANAFVSGFLDLGLQGPDETKAGPDLKFVHDIVRQIATRLDKPRPYRSPWGSLFSVGSDSPSAGYFLSDDEKILFVLAKPVSKEGSFTGNQAAIEGVRAVIASLRGDFPNVRVGVTGKPALSNDEMTSAFRDSQRATIVAFALTLGLLLVAFLRVGKPIAMLVILALSLCWSIGAATLVIGHLSLFSVMFISIVIGIGIDYGIYFLFRYEEEIFLGRSLKEAIEIASARSGPGMLLGAATASATFYVLMFTDFRGLQELGFIAGTAILFAWLAMMTVFPAALVLIDRRHATRPPVTIPRAIRLERIHVPFVDYLTGYPRTVAALAAALTVVCAWAVPRVHFDYNLLNLQAVGTESVVWEKRIVATAGRSGFTGLAVATSLDELRRKQAAFRALPSVADVDSALLFVPDGQEEKLKIIRDFAPLVAPVRVARPLPVDLDRLETALETLHRRFELAANEAPAGETQRDLAATRDDIASLIVKLRESDRDTSEAALTLLQRQLYRDFVSSFQQLQANLSPRIITLADLPVEMKRKFISPKGRFLLQIHPAVDIWDRDGAQRFVTELRGVDPDVTGTPIVTYEAIRLMERAYKQGTVFAILLVSTITALMLRRVRETLLALLPLALGLTWTAGLMWTFKVKFNLGNLFGLPLILGAAAEYGLNIVLRYMEGRDHGGPLIARSTIMGVLVSGLTTIAGFGTLMLAAHRGIYSLGLLLTLGTAASLAAALIVLPVVIRMATPRGAAPPSSLDAATGRAPLPSARS